MLDDSFIHYVFLWMRFINFWFWIVSCSVANSSSMYVRLPRDLSLLLRSSHQAGSFFIIFVWNSLLRAFFLPQPYTLGASKAFRSSSHHLKCFLMFCFFHLCVIPFCCSVNTIFLGTPCSTSTWFCFVLFFWGVFPMTTIIFWAKIFSVFCGQ